MPDAPSPSRPGRPRPGLTTYVLEESRSRIAGEGRAFPTWAAAQIPRCAEREPPRPRTLADLTRVGGDSADKGAPPRAPPQAPPPDDGSQLCRHRRPARSTGFRPGLAKGIARERVVVRGLAVRTFGPLTAEQIAEILAGKEDPIPSTKPAFSSSNATTVPRCSPGCPVPARALSRGRSKLGSSVHSSPVVALRYPHVAARALPIDEVSPHGRFVGRVRGSRSRRPGRCARTRRARRCRARSCTPSWTGRRPCGRGGSTAG